MNNLKKYEDVEYHFDEVKFNESGIITNHPLDYLYEYFPESNRNARNLHDLIFAGDGLDQSKILNDVKMFELRFYGEPDSIHYREEWADPLRADILKSLSSNERSWYLSFDGYSPYNLEYRDKVNVSPEVLDFFSRKEKNHVVFIDSHKRSKTDGKPIKRLFVEVTHEEIESAVKMIWPLAWNPETIQGYNFLANRIDLVKEWESSKKDEKLFRRLLDENEVFFFSYPEEHRHFIFISNKYSSSEFVKKIRLQDLRKKADELLKAEGFRK